MTLLERGRALALLGKYKSAMNWYDKVLAIDPSTSLAETDKQKSKHYLNKKLNIDPKYISLLGNKGNLLS